MDLLPGLLLITSIHLLAAASPGPDFILVSQQTLSNGKTAGLMCSIGIALGLSIHIIYSALGLAAVIANSESALWAIKILGGCYLLYLGFSGLRAKPDTSISNNQPRAIKYSNKKSIGLVFCAMHSIPKHRSISYLYLPLCYHLTCPFIKLQFMEFG